MKTRDELVKGIAAGSSHAVRMENVSEACTTLGYSGDTFCRPERRYEEAGIEGLPEISRRKPNPCSRVPQEIETERPGNEAEVIEILRNSTDRSTESCGEYASTIVFGRTRESAAMGGPGMLR